MPGVTTTQAVLKTYVYRFISQIGPSNPFPWNIFYPTDPNNTNSGFTLYTKDLTAIGINDLSSEISYLNIYPNPSIGVFTLGFSSEKNAKANIKVTDLLGKIVYERNEFVVSGINRYNVSLCTLSKGIYFVNLSVENTKSLVKKIILE